MMIMQADQTRREGGGIGIDDGTPFHSLFDLAAQRRGWIDGASNGVDQDAVVDAALDELATGPERHVAVDRLRAIAGQAG
jgi:adenosylcobyric acid synthase